MAERENTAPRRYRDGHFKWR